jgi:hypothetical protein
VHGGFVRYTEESNIDKDGNAVMSSSLEPIKGKAVEWDRNRPKISITLNTLALPSVTMDVVNDAQLWGFSLRCVKLSNATYERLAYGLCSYYFRVTYDFDIDVRTFDREVLDEGTRVLKGYSADHEATDPKLPASARFDPANFETYTDKRGNPTTVFLDGLGAPAYDPANYVKIPIKKYPNYNMLLLGIPDPLN